MSSAVASPFSARRSKFNLPLLSSRVAIISGTVSARVFPSIVRVAPPVGSEAVLGYVQVELDGYKDPMAVMVLIDDGYAYCIEGSTARRSLAGVDLAELNFRIVPSRA